MTSTFQVHKVHRLLVCLQQWQHCGRCDTIMTCTYVVFIEACYTDPSKYMSDLFAIGGVYSIWMAYLHNLLSLLEQ